MRAAPCFSPARTYDWPDINCNMIGCFFLLFLLAGNLTQMPDLTMSDPCIQLDNVNAYSVFYVHVKDRVSLKLIFLDVGSVLLCL